jgi:4-hydroxy-tetrahydrodipicolinate synthase
MFIDTNPIPVKKAVELCGMAAGPVRLPLDELDAQKTGQLSAVLAAAGLLAGTKKAVAKKAKKAPAQRTKKTGRR